MSKSFKPCFPIETHVLNKWSSILREKHTTFPQTASQLNRFCDCKLLEFGSRNTSLKFFVHFQLRLILIPRVFQFHLKLSKKKGSSYESMDTLTTYKENKHLARKALPSVTDNCHKSTLMLKRKKIKLHRILLSVLFEQNTTYTLL